MSDNLAVNGPPFADSNAPFLPAWTDSLSTSDNFRGFGSFTAEERALLPDHTQLPCDDGAIVNNFQEHPESIILTESLRPELDRRYPGGFYCIGQDTGIYWRLPRPGENPLMGAVAPDWFYVPNVPPLLSGQIRRSYVLWKELISPPLVIEFVSNNDGVELDKTPFQGKFWIYEQAVKATYYVIYWANPTQLSVFKLIDGRYQSLAANSAGRYPIDVLDIEFGIWQGKVGNEELPWLRAWDQRGNLLLVDAERASVEKAAREDAQRFAQSERIAKEALQQQLNSLHAKLREMGIDPDQLSSSGN